MTLTLFKDGSLCEPDAIYAEVSNLYVIDTGDVNLDFQSDALQIDISEIIYSDDNKFVTHANVANFFCNIRGNVSIFSHDRWVNLRPIQGGVLN